MSSQNKPHFFFVHGAYHGAWCWDLVREDLEKHGYTSSAIDLPSAGNDSDLATDVKLIVAHIENQARTYERIIPVFHSYGGVPGGDALGQLPLSTKPQIARVIHLASFIVPAGEPLIRNLIDPKTSPHWARFVEPACRMRYVPDPIPTFYQDVEPSLAREAAARITQHSVTSVTDATVTAGWTEFDATYVRCTEDRALAPHLWENVFKPRILQAGVRGRWRYREIAGSHSPFLARVDELSRVLREEVGDEVDSDTLV